MSTYKPSALTPDFYTYDWDPPTSITIDGSFVVIRWADGVELPAFDLWLRENAVGAGGVDVATREGLIDPADHASTTRATDARIAEDGSVRVRWSPDGIEADYHPGWLRHVALGLHRPDGFLPTPVVWTADELPEPPTHDGRHVLVEVDVQRHFVNDLLSYGIARLRNVGVDADFGLTFGSCLGAIRDTNFGPTWDVKADVRLAGSSVTNSTANTSLRLGPHTDLPTRETPPGFQFLHCLANTTEGGHSTMADGAAVVECLRTQHPEHYESLTTLNWVFFNRGPGIDHRWSGPIIDLGASGAPLTLRAFYPVRGFPDMEVGDMARAYEAMSIFSRLAADDRFQMRYPFEPGDLVGFDNRRILHGRDAFSASGRRHLRGLYIDHDEIRSFARVANRQYRRTEQQQESSDARSDA